MLRHNVDFFALFFIVVGMLAFSKLPALAMPRLEQPIRFQKALTVDDRCPATEVLSQLGLLLNR